MKSRHLTIAEAVEAQVLNGSNPHRALRPEQAEYQEELRSTFRHLKDTPGKLIVPFADPERRGMSVTGGTSGQYGGDLVATQVPEAGIALRSALRLPALGARFFPGLVGDVNLPYGTGSVSAEWLSETDDATDVDEVLGVLSLTPKRVTAAVPISLQLMIQGGPLFADWINSALTDLLAVEIERVAINGASANEEPVGILNTPGIGAVVGGTNGAAADYLDLVNLEFEVTGTGQADRGPHGWLTSPKVRRKLRTTMRVGSTDSAPVWPVEGPVTPIGYPSLLGYPAAVTNACPDNLTKGASEDICSAIIFGQFSELFVGLWGGGIGVEIVRDVTLAKSGQVLAIATAYVDCGVRNPKAFAAMRDVLTT